MAAVLAFLTVTGVGIWNATSRIVRAPWYAHRVPFEGLRPVDGEPIGDSVWQGATHDPKTDLGLDYADVELGTAGGARLRGWLVPGAPGARVAVVTVHGAGADRREFLRHVPVLHAAGYPVLLFDCREHGISDGAGRGISLGAREHEDVSAAVAYLRAQHGAERVAVIGTSQGAASAILAGASDRGIDAVVAENSFARFEDVLRESEDARGAPPVLVALTAAVARWRMDASAVPDPLDVVARVAPTPLLLLHGSADRVISPRHTEALFAAAGEPKELWIAPGAEHAMLFNAHPAEWSARVLGFLHRHVGAP